MKIKKNEIGTYIFFLWLILLIIDRMYDLSIFFIGITIILMGIHFLFGNHGKVYIKPLSKQSALVKLYSVFLVYELTVTMIAFTIDYSSYLLSGMKTFIMIPCLMFLVTYYFSGSINWKKLFFLLRNFGIFVAFLSIIETLTAQSIFYRFLDEQAMKLTNVAYVGTSEFRSFACFCHPIIASVIFLITICLCIYYPLKVTMLEYSAVGITCFALYGTKSRSAWLAFIFIIMIILLDKIKLNRKMSVKTFAKIFKTIIIFMALFFIFKDELFYMVQNIINRFSIVLRATSNANSKIVRLSNIQNVFLYIKKYPLYAMTGRGNDYEMRFSSEHIINNFWSYGMDNQYLSFILNTGFIGTILILIILILSFLIFLRNKDTLIKIAMLIGQSIFLTCFFFDGLDKWRVINYFFCLFLFYKSNQEDFNKD